MEWLVVEEKGGLKAGKGVMWSKMRQQHRGREGQSGLGNNRESKNDTRIHK